MTNRLHELELKKEYAHIQSELRQAVHRDSFALFPEWGVTGDAVNFCVAAVIRGLVFPSSDSRVLVNYPLYLRLVRRPHGHRCVTPALQVGVPAVGRLPGRPAAREL